MAEWWDWTAASADRDRSRQLALGDMRMRRLEADYDRQVLESRLAAERARGVAGGTPWAPKPEPYFRQLPAETRMAAMAEHTDILSPKNYAPGVGKFLAETARWPLEIGSRPRDTLIRSAQELSEGNYGSALGYLARAPLSVVAPAAAAGRPYDDDDWQERARGLNVSERDILAIDLATDPTTYVGAGLLRRAPRMGMDLLNTLRSQAGKMRYGQGAPTFIESAAGDVLMRTRNSPAAALERLALPGH